MITVTVTVATLYLVTGVFIAGINLVADRLWQHPTKVWIYLAIVFGWPWMMTR